LLLVSSSDPAADAVALHRAAIEAAVTAGVGRVLYASHQGAATDSPFGPGRDHALTEQLLAQSGLPWTSLRNGFYLHSLQWLLGSWRETGAIAVPGDGPVSWTARSDAAEAAAAIILSGGAHDGPVTITATSAPTFADIARLASDLTGRKVRLELLDPEERIRVQTASGHPEFMARFLLGMYQAAADGFFAGTDPLSRALIGREL
jgi:NAD(P)H dehydrogenase (quinone)